MIHIGVISDTHGLLRDEALRALEGVNFILHAGDVGAPEILTALKSIAPVIAIRGNVDLAGPCSELPLTEPVEIGGKIFYLVHSLSDLDIDPKAGNVDVVVSGHSHKALIDWRDDVLYLNPGSAGPRRFKLPVTLAFVTISDRIEAQIVDLAP